MATSGATEVKKRLTVVCAELRALIANDPAAVVPIPDEAEANSLIGRAVTILSADSVIDDLARSGAAGSRTTFRPPVLAKDLLVSTTLALSALPD